MTSEDFVVRIADLDAGPRRVQQPISEAWLARALADTDATPWLEPAGGAPGEVDLEVAKNGRQILVRGRIRARVALPCARTLDPALYELEPEVFLLLHPAPEEAATEMRPHRARGRADKAEAHPAQRKPGKEAQRKVGPGKEAQRKETAPSGKKGKKGAEWSEDPELGDEDAALDTYSGEQLRLDGFIREFIVLEFPMFPLREDLRSDPARASSALPSGAEATLFDGDRPLDPRLSPLAELKARLEKKE